MRQYILPSARALALGIAIAALSPLGCKSNKAAVEQVLTQPVPAPDGLLAEVVATTPDTSFQRVRAKMGGPAQLLPSSFPSLVVTVLGLPAIAAELIDANLPVYGALLDDPGKPQIVLGVHVREGARLVTVLSAGNEARYDAKPEPSGLTVLEPKPSQTSRVASLAVSNNYLIIGTSAEAVKRAGAYVARTLPTRAPQTGDLVVSAGRAALSGPIAKRMHEGWAAYKKEKEKDDAELRAQHGGRAPDFADPTAAIADIDSKINRFASVVSDLDEARLMITTDDFGLHSQLFMTPTAGSGVASLEMKAMSIGAISPLLESPRDSLFAVVFNDSSEQRKLGAKEQSDGVARLLGDRLAAAEKTKLDTTLSNWASGRGDWLAASFLPQEDGKSFWVRGSVANAESFDKSVLGVLDLLGVPAFGEPIKHHFGTIKLAKPVVSGDIKTVRTHREYMVKQRDGKEQVEKLDFDFAWQVDPKGLFSMVMASDAKAWLGPNALRRPSLADDPEALMAVKLLGNEASFVFYFQPLRFLASMMSRGGESKAASAPILFSYGRTKADGWFRLDLSYVAAREFLRMNLGH